MLHKVNFNYVYKGTTVTWLGLNNWPPAATITNGTSQILSEYVLFSGKYFSGK